MPFDPAFPPHGVGLVSADWRAQFNSLKALIDGLQAQVDALLPIGIIVGWPKSLPAMPALPGTWVECNGQLLSDGESPLDGQAIPDLNSGQLFLRGATASGGTGGAEVHAHDVDLSGTSAGDPGASGGSTVPWATYPTTSASSLPPHYEVVWVMRVK